MLGTSVEPGGKRDVFGPQLGFFTQRLPGDCVVNELISSEQFFIAKNDEVTALIIINGQESFIAARRTNTFTFSTPYLSWAWEVELHDRSVHPIRMVF
ncbi:MAG: hypothetical protein CFH05_01549, partial [Alphaproteobacteria bacterium MarineAlpha3_Bin4]